MDLLNRKNISFSKLTYFSFLTYLLIYNLSRYFIDLFEENYPDVKYGLLENKYIYYFEKYINYLYLYNLNSNVIKRRIVISKYFYCVKRYTKYRYVHTDKYAS